MRFKNSAAMFFLSIFMSAAFCQSNENNIKFFIKGNISDKITALKNASGRETAVLAVKTVDFILQNLEDTGFDDRDINNLAITGILALPANIVNTDNTILTKLYKLFELSQDSTIKIAVLEKIVLFQETKPSTESVNVLNNFLSESIEKKQSGDVQKNAVISLGKIGNGQSFSILYDCLQTECFSPYSKEILEALGNLADKSLSEILQILSSTTIDRITEIFDLIKNNSKISASFKAEIAENILSEAINNTEENENPEVQKLEFDAFCIIVESNWTRASSLINSYFMTSKAAFESSKMKDSQFVKIIEGVSQLATAEVSQVLTNYLTELNKQTEKGGKVSETIILALVKSLGELGNKNAFDQLLLATYLDYPQTVIAEARISLTKLKWEN